MAKLSRDDVFKLAKLARIKLSDDESANFANEITRILDYVEQLAKVDIAGLKPTNQLNGLSNVWREDELIDYGFDPKELMKNVPKVRDGFIEVGRMIE